jgi:hypothetical protein
VAAILYPMTGRAALAAVRRGQDGRAQVYLQLEPGQSFILRTFSSRKVGGPNWRYLREIGEPFEIRGTWQVTFIEGGPKLPVGFETHTLASWTQLGDNEAKRLAGTALYKIVFDKPSDGADDWVLDLGRVCESARVRINGRHVTNPSANRIADLDHRKVNWKKFYEINFVNIKYRKFDASNWPLTDSGLLGPVRLIRSALIELGAK